MTVPLDRTRGAHGSASDAPAAGSGAMFDRIAARYDLLNRILSLGLDRRWRRAAVRALGLRPGSVVVDLATGTADVALEVLRQEPRARVVGLDPSPRMLDAGRRKVAAAGLEDRIELRSGSADSLPFEDGAVDGVTIAFGIRNVPDRARALREMARITRPSGRVAILELLEPRHGWLGLAARAYVRRVVPAVGALLSGSREYRYLQRSMAAFPPPHEFAALMQASGLDSLEVRPLSFGVTCLFVGAPRESGS